MLMPGYQAYKPHLEFFERKTQGPGRLENISDSYRGNSILAIIPPSVFFVEVTTGEST